MDIMDMDTDMDVDTDMDTDMDKDMNMDTDSGQGHWHQNLETHQLSYWFLEPFFSSSPCKTALRPQLSTVRGQYGAAYH